MWELWIRSKSDYEKREGIKRYSWAIKISC